MKAKERVYRGIEFICLDELPADQKLLLQHNRLPERIKILVDGKILSNCIQYHKYNAWYNHVYETSVEAAAIEPVQGKVFIPTVELNLSKV